MTEPRADLVAVDHHYLEAIRNGRAPTDPDRLAEFLLAWRAEVEEYLRASYRRNRVDLFGAQEPAMAEVSPYPPIRAAMTWASEVDPTAMPPEDEHQHGGDA